MLMIGPDSIWRPVPAPFPHPAEVVKCGEAGQLLPHLLNRGEVPDLEEVILRHIFVGSRRA